MTKDCWLIGHQSTLTLTCMMPFASPDYIFSVKLEQFRVSGHREIILSCDYDCVLQNAQNITS